MKWSKIFFLWYVSLMTKKLPTWLKEKTDVTCKEEKELNESVKLKI